MPQPDGKFDPVYLLLHWGILPMLCGLAFAASDGPPLSVTDWTVGEAGCVAMALLTIALCDAVHSAYHRKTKGRR